MKSLYEFQSIEVIRDDKKMMTCIGRVEVGDMIRSRDEETHEDVWVEILDIHDHGELELTWVMFDDGSSVKCTMGHKFRVTDGRMLPLWMIIEEDLDVVTKVENE